MKLLPDRVCIITGATEGMGRATARLFSEHGARVVVCSRREERCRAVADELRARYGADPLPVAADISVQKDVDELVRSSIKKYSRIDVLVNYAGNTQAYGRLRNVPIHELSDEDLRSVLDVDLLGTFRTCRTVLPHMMKQRNGVIINVSSTPTVAGHSEDAVYMIAKGGVSALTKNMAKHYGPYNIRANVIAPGNIKNPTTWNVLSEEERRRGTEEAPLKRWGEAEDIAGVALMLASDYASFVTGQTVVVDGGTVTF